MLGQRPSLRCPPVAGSRHLIVAPRFGRCSAAHVSRSLWTRFSPARATATQHDQLPTPPSDLHVSVRTVYRKCCPLSCRHVRLRILLKQLMQRRDYVSQMHACKKQLGADQICHTTSRNPNPALTYYFIARRCHMEPSAAARGSAGMGAAF